MTPSTASRYYQARAGIFVRLTQGERLSDQDAERWITAWERHAEAIRLHHSVVWFWDTGWDWIAKHRRK